MRLLTTAAVAAILSVAAPAAAGARVPSTPMQLPGDASASAVRADRATWLVGAAPSAATTAIARRHGAHRVVEGGWVVARDQARPLAAELRAKGLLTYAEPNRFSVLHQDRQVPNDPLSAGDPWRDYAVSPLLLPPTVSPTSPLVALVDAKADVSHPEFSGGNLATLTVGGSADTVSITHGTATAAVAGAAVNGIGMVGVWPGARELNIPLPPDSISCADSARGIVRAIAAGAAVINMSYGSGSFCQTEYEAIQAATKRGISLVAAAGNEYDQGNPLEFPASLPHVITVGALAPGDKAAYFSNENAAMDLVAPGQGIVSAVPVALDNEDGTKDGYEIVDGTSFSAPMVSAATGWLRQLRPDLTVDQVAQVIRLSARDIGSKGYDTSTGFGALDLAAALFKKPPVADPLEPNEDIPFVNGRAFKQADRAIWKGSGRKTLRALLDVFEDPGDVYRLRVPAHRRVTVSTKPSFGNPDLELYTSAATHVAQARHRAARSRHTGTRTDTVTYRNTTSKTRTAYVRVFINPRQRTLDAGYTLTARRGG